MTLTYCQVCLQPLSVREALWDRHLNGLATEFYEKFGLAEFLINFLLRSSNHPPHKALLLQVTLTYCQVCLQPLSVREALWDRHLNDLATEVYEKFGLAEFLINFLLRSSNHPPHKALLLQVTLTYCQVCLQPLSVREALWDRHLNDLATEVYEKFGLADFHGVVVLRTERPQCLRMAFFKDLFQLLTLECQYLKHPLFPNPKRTVQNRKLLMTYYQPLILQEQFQYQHL